MSYRIINHRDYIANTGVERAYILDEPTGKVIAEVTSAEGVRPLVELANRAAAEAVEAAKKRTIAVGTRDMPFMMPNVTVDRLRIAVEALEAIAKALDVGDGPTPEARRAQEALNRMALP